MAERIYFRPKRSIGGFTADVTIEEQHNDSAGITDHPVERGAAVSDHAYRNPAQLTVVVGWSNSSQAAGRDPTYVQRVYEKILALQNTYEPFSVVTGKRVYRNMLIQALATTTGRETENVLILTVTMREIIIVASQTTTVPPRENQAEPQKTQEVSQGGSKQLQPAPKVNTSALATIFGG
jgi:hypothetical protein